MHHCPARAEVVFFGVVVVFFGAEVVVLVFLRVMCLPGACADIDRGRSRNRIKSVITFFIFCLIMISLVVSAKSDL